MFAALLFQASLSAIPEHLASLYASVDEETARASSACVRTEDQHVCPNNAAAGTQEFCCVNPQRTSSSFNNCGGTRPTGLPFAGRSPAYAQHGMAATSVML